MRALVLCGAGLYNGSAEVIALLREASRTYEQTLVMITHNRAIAQSADRVLQVSDGVLTVLLAALVSAAGPAKRMRKMSVTETIGEL